MSNSITRKEVESLIQALKNEMYDCFKALGPAGIAAVGDVTRDEPGIGPRRGKNYAGVKFNLRPRIDMVLADLLYKEAVGHYGGNMSRCLDVILWRHFNRPRLSWEADPNG